MSTNNTNTSLVAEFMKVVDTGDEKAARAFLIENLKQFPKPLQEKIASAFFFEALEKKADSIEKRAQVQNAVLGIFEDIKKTEQKLTEEKQKIEVREKLDKHS